MNKYAAALNKYAAAIDKEAKRQNSEKIFASVVPVNKGGVNFFANRVYNCVVEVLIF